MAISNKIQNFQMTVNQHLLDKAQALAPTLLESNAAPVGTVDILPAGRDFTARPARHGFA